MIDNNSNIRLVKREQVTYIESPILDGYPILHGFSTRLGGASKGYFSKMNLSFTRGDEDNDVRTNHERFAEAVGYEVQNLVMMEQVHSTNIRRVGRNDIGKVFSDERSIKKIDGMVTDEPGVVLMTFFADCVPILFYDPVRKAVGAAHAGWRGTVHNMAAAMVLRMKEEFGSKPEELVAVIGPSICQSCYEVSKEVIDEVVKIVPEREQGDVFYEKDNGHYQLDLWELNKKNLLKVGMKKGNISVTGFCTNCNPDLLFSHRFTNGKRGNLAGVIGLI